MENDERSRLSVRLPPDVKDWLGSRARSNGWSQNAEIIQMIRRQMASETETAGEPVKTTPTA